MSDRDQKHNAPGAEANNQQAVASDRRMARAMKMVEANPIQREMYNQNPAAYLQSLGIETPEADSGKLGLRTETLAVLDGDRDVRRHLTLTLTPFTWPGPTMGGPTMDPSRMTITATCSFTVSNQSTSATNTAPTGSITVTMQTPAP